MRETVAQLNEIFESQDRQIEILRSDVTLRDSELLAGKEQIRKLSVLLSQKMAGQLWNVCNKHITLMKLFLQFDHSISYQNELFLDF